MHVCRKFWPIMFGSFARLLFAVCITLFSAMAAHAQSQDMRLQVLNGKTGRPIVHTHVLLWRSMNHEALLPGTKPDATTDGEGYVALPNTEAQFLVFYADGFQPCSKTFVRTFSLTDVRMRGVASENNCRAHIHMYPLAGTLIVFVRPETFLERMRR